MTKTRSPLVATSTTLRTNGTPKPSPIPRRPAIHRWRVPRTAEKVSSLTRGAPAGPGRRLARVDVRGAEEVRDLEGRRLHRVRAVHGVGLDGRGEVLPDRPRRGFR